MEKFIGILKKVFGPVIPLRNMPQEVYDQVVKFIMLNSFVLILGLILTLVYFNLFFVIAAIIIDVLYSLSFYFLFYRYFSLGKIIFFEGEIVSISEWNPTSLSFLNKKINGVYHRYVRSTYRFKITDANSFEEVNVVYPYNERKRLDKGKKVRIYVLPEHIFAKSNGETTINHVVLTTPL